MATAELPASAGEKLWGNYRIPIIGGTGDFGSGKTVFGLTISPYTLDFDHPPDTKVWDSEGSSATYEGMFNFDRVELTRLVGDRYKPIDLFLAWRENVLATPEGQYRVGMLDTIEEIERGLVDYVHANPEEFGRTAMQYQKAQGLMWGDVKDLWQRILDVEVAKRFETFYFVAHLKDEWKGQSTTGRRVPKGKETLEKLASLYLRFDRKMQGGVVREVPVAEVIKSRLVVMDKSRKIVPMLPPRIDKATSETIRNYIANPPNYDKLKKTERAEERKLSDEDRLAMESQIAADRVEAERLAASRLEQIRSAAARQGSGKNGQVDRPAADQSAQRSAQREGAAKSRAAGEAKLTRSQANELRELAGQVFGEDVDAYVAKLKALGADKTDDLTAANAHQLIEDLTALRSSQADGEGGGSHGSDEASPFDGASDADETAREARENDPCSQVQLDRLNELANALEMTAEDVSGILSKRGVAKATELTWRQAEDLIGKLLSLTQELPDGSAKN